MDIESLYKQFGSPGESSDSSGVDIHGLAKEFGGPKTAEKASAIKVRPVAPPISGATQEQSDIINSQSATPAGSNPRSVLPETKIQEKAYEAHVASKELLNEAAKDFESGHPYKAFAKGLLGLVSNVAAPVQGIIEGGPQEIATQVTGNKDFGEKVGLVVGTALPVSKVGKTAIEAIPKNTAFKNLIETIGPENAGKVAKELRANPRLSPADLSPAVESAVQKLFVTEGDKTKNYLGFTVDQRLKSAKQAVETAFNETMGRPVDAFNKIEQLKKNIKAKGAEINPIVKSAKPVDLTDTIKHIDQQIKPGINSIITGGEQLPLGDIGNEMKKVRAFLTNDKAVMTDPDRLHKLQSVFRSTADKLLSSANGQDRMMGGALMQVRNKIVDAIDKSANGKYKPALKNYRDETHIQDAFEHGHDAIITNSRKLEGRPEFFREWVKNASKEELEAAREGARLAIDTTINGFKGAARRGTDVGEAEFNKTRIRELFGKEEGDKLFKKLSDERRIAEVNNNLVKNSQTAMRTAAESKIALPTKTELGQGAAVGAALETANILAHGYPGVGTATLIAGKGMSAAKHAIETKLAKERNLNFAKYALPVEEPKREELIRALEAVAAQQGPKPKLTQRAANSIVRLIGP